MSDIHPSALIDPHAQLADNISIGPFCIIGPEVQIGPGCRIDAHAMITGQTVLGANNHIYPFALLGEDPQDLNDNSNTSQLIIGDNNTIRERVTIHRGTSHSGGVTQIGDHNFLMVDSHIAHDCHVGNHCLFVNGAGIGGHVTVGDHAVLSAHVLVHQLCRIGRHSFCAASSCITRDVPPFCCVQGYFASCYGINRLGLRKRGFSTHTMAALHRSYRLLFRGHISRRQAMLETETLALSYPAVAELLQFLKSSRQGIVKGRSQSLTRNIKILPTKGTSPNHDGLHTSCPLEDRDATSR